MMGRGSDAPSFLCAYICAMLKMEWRIMRQRFAEIIAMLLVTLVLVGGRARADDAIEAKAKVCAACHGDQGVPMQKVIPVIWGQNAGYLFYQLRDFKSGARKNEHPIAATLERDDMMGLAQYFSRKPWPDLTQPRAARAAAAQALGAITSVVCTSCHQEGYKGEGTQPRLAGQERDYLAQTMLDFRTGKRGNNPGMSALMKSISEGDIAVIAEYLAGLSGS